MQKRKNDRIDILTDYIMADDFIRAMSKSKNQFVAMHNPGSIIEKKDGTLYVVGERGNWIKVATKHISK